MDEAANDFVVKYVIILDIERQRYPLYSHGSRRLLLKLLEIFQFRSNRIEEKSLLDAIEFIKQNQDNVTAYSHDIQKIPMIDMLSRDRDWHQIITESKVGSMLNGILNALLTNEFEKRLC